jgi:thiosulfate reductase cytochrome b subunit
MKRPLGSYPLWLRCWHWSNALLFVILLITGLSMHYSQPGPPPITFRIDVLVHNAAGLLLVLFYCLFLYGNMRLGNGRYYEVSGADLNPGLWRQARYYLWGIFVGSPHPYPDSGERKFNPLQKLIYLVVMYVLFPVIIVTGWGLLFPQRLPDRMLGAPGLTVFALTHTYIGFSLSLFMVVHIYLGSTGTTLGELVRFMWSGNVEHPEVSPRLRTRDFADHPDRHVEVQVAVAKERP